MAEKWSEWKELDGESLYATVPYEFPGSWEYHDAEFRMKDGSVVVGQIYPDEALTKYTDENGEVFDDYYKEWYFVDQDCCSVDVGKVVAWRYKLEDE